MEWRAEAEFRAEQVRMRAGETRFRMMTPQGAVEMRSPLTGRVNVYNLLAASAAAWARGLTLEADCGGRCRAERRCRGDLRWCLQERPALR